jgi:protein-S-isoprenylcysteine O-methyltransferase Ste14
VNPRLRIPPALVVVLCGGLMWALNQAAPLARLVAPPVTRVGGLLVLLGLCIAAAAIVQFRRARTTVDPTRPAKASALVQSGIFGYSRNPMYLGMGVVLCGWALLLGSLSPWFVVPLFAVLLTWLQIRPEEAVLTTLFGPEYTRYCARVGRWFGRRS